MGFYGDNRPLMNALRTRLLREPAEFLDIWRPIRDEYPLFTNSFKRMAIPEELHPELALWYPAKGFYVAKDIHDFDLIKSPRLADEITAGFVRIVGENGLTAWQAGAKCAPWVFWITLPTLFVGAICVCKRVTKWGGLVKTLLIGGLITLIVGILLGVLALVAYGTGFVANPARTCMLVAMALVTVAEQVAIFQKEI
jgi:hypothetical protein